MAIDPLAQLEGFLAQDPGNDGLRAECLDTALRLGRGDRAQAHLDAGMASGVNPLGWQLRRAHWLMSQHAWQAAHSVLSALLVAPDAPQALQAAARHDLSLVCLRTGQIDEGLALLGPLTETMDPPDPSTQALWLRLHHHADRADEAVAAARQWAQAKLLAPEAAGVASLAALDLGEMALCQSWSRLALSQLPRQMEALVSQGSLALAAQSAPAAKQWLGQALAVNPQDGRALSAWAFAEMLGGELQAARSTFAQALKNMPEHIGTWHGQGWAELLQGDLAAARRTFEHALALDRNFAESHGAMAVVLARLGDRSAAESAMAIARRLDPHCISAEYARAILEGRADDPRELQRIAAGLLTARAQRPTP